MINLKKFNYSYDNHLIFNNLSLDIAVGSSASLVMSNSGGKTTLFNALKEKYSKDSLFFPGEIKSFYEDDLIINHLLKVAKAMNVKGAHDFISTLCESYYIKEESLYNKITEISDFEAAKISLLLIELTKPKLIVLDNTYLFYRTREQDYLFSKLKQISESIDSTVVYLTHNLKNTLYFNDLGVILDGELILYGTTKSVLKETKIIEDMKLALPFYVNLSINLKLYKLIERIGYSNKEVGDLLWKE